MTAPETPLNERERFSEWWHPRVEEFSKERDNGRPFWRHPWLAWKERAAIADRALAASQAQVAELRAMLDFLRLEAENMALSLESAGFGRPNGQMCTPLERYRAAHPHRALLARTQPEPERKTPRK